MVPTLCVTFTGLTKVRWFGFFVATKKKKDQATSGNDQDAADPNQFCRHKEFLSNQRDCVSMSQRPFGRIRR